MREKGFTMDSRKWQGVSFANVLEFNMMAAEMTEDLAAQLSKEGNRIHKSIPTNYAFGAIATSADGSKFLRITTGDLRESDDWLDAVELCEMTANREPKDDAVHICSWDEIGTEAAKYLA